MAKILVIEDNPVNMKLAALLLRNAGHVVLGAVNAETGLTRARAERPDLILMDFQLPGMDGLAATALLTQDAATAAIPVIALTALAMESDQDRSRLAGCDAYIAKPLRYQELYATIDRLLVAAGLPVHGADFPAPQEVRLPGGATQAVDLRVLEDLIGNDPAVTAEFLASFRVSATRIALGLQAACINQQAPQAARQAHKLKSSAHTVGALGLGLLCGEMETAGKAGNTTTLAALLPKFSRELAAVNAVLDPLLARWPSTMANQPDEHHDC